MPDPTAVVEVETSQGPARVHRYAVSGTSRGVLLLGHGAGGGVGAADLQVLTRLVEHGWEIGLVEQPWRVAGRKVATRPPALDAAWRDLVPRYLERHPAPRVAVGGRSAGARVACRNAPGDAAIGLPRAVAVVCLAFPLHPPGRPEKSRVAELQTPLADGIPTLVVQGLKDPFGPPTEVTEALGADPGPVTVHPVPGNHSPTTRLVAMCGTVADWLDAHTDGLP